MPGGGIRPENAKQFLKLDVAEIHTGSKIKVPSRMKSVSGVKMGSDDSQEYHMFVDVEAIRSIVETVRGECLC